MYSFLWTTPWELGSPTHARYSLVDMTVMVWLQLDGRGLPVWYNTLDSRGLPVWNDTLDSRGLSVCYNTLDSVWYSTVWYFVYIPHSKHWVGRLSVCSRSLSPLLRTLTTWHYCYSPTSGTPTRLMSNVCTLPSLIQQSFNNWFRICPSRQVQLRYVW